MKNKDLIDFKAILAPYLKKWWWFAISVVVCCALGFIYSKVKTKTYTVRASVVLSESAASKLLSGGFSAVSDLLGGNSNGEDEAMIMSSHTVLRDVCTDLGLTTSHWDRPFPLVKKFLYREYPVDVVPGENINLDTLTTKLVFTVKVADDGHVNVKLVARDKKLCTASASELPMVMSTPYGDFTVRATDDYVPGESFKNAVVITSADRAAEDIQEFISIGLATKHSSIIEMMMTTPDRDYAKEVLNDIIRIYNERGVAMQQQQTGRTATFLNDRINLLIDDLHLTENQIEQYKDDQGVVDLAADGEYRLARLSAIEAQLIPAQTQTEILTMTLDFVKNSENAFATIPTPVTTGTDAIAPTIKDYNTLILRRERMLETTSEDNAAVVTLDRQISSIRSNIITSLERAVASSRRAEADIRAVYNQTLAQVGSIPGQERDMRDLLRRQKIQEEIYVFLLQKQEETNILLSNAGPKGQVIDAAYSLKDDDKSGTMGILIICFLLGMAIPAAYIYLKQDKKDNTAEA